MWLFRHVHTTLSQPAQLKQKVHIPLLWICLKLPCLPAQPSSCMTSCSAACGPRATATAHRHGPAQESVGVFGDALCKVMNPDRVCTVVTSLRSV